MSTSFSHFLPCIVFLCSSCGEASPSAPVAAGGGSGTAGSAAAGDAAVGGSSGAVAGSAAGGVASAGAAGGVAGAGGLGGNSAGASTGGGGASGPGGAGGSAPIDPNAPCPRCVKIFDGTSFEHWEASPNTWQLKDGAMLGEGGSSRAAYTKKDYGNVRLIVSSRLDPVNGDHLGILFWGNRPQNVDTPQIDGAGWLQWMPPSGTMWSYHPPQHHFVQGMEVGDADVDQTEWHTSELLLDLDAGTLRAAVDGVEITRYTHPWPTEREDPEHRIVPGPLAMMRHGGGGSLYKDIWVEADPVDDKLYTVE